MNFLRNLGDQLRDLWQRSNNAYRVAFIALSAIAVMTVIMVGWWSSRPQYIPLADNLSPAEAADIRAKLQTDNIPHRLGFSASTIEVPESRWSDARLAARDVLPSSSSTPEQNPNGILVDPQTARQSLLHERQRRLEQTLLRMRSIESANVHIAMPEQSVFLRDKGEVKASVMLGIRRGMTFTPEMASTVAATVAGAIENLTIGNVTVTDQDGRVLAAQGLTPDQGFTHHFDYRRRVEADIAAKAEDALTRMLGEGRAVVRVSADIDFTETETIAQTYDPDSQIRISESIQSEKTSPNSGTAAGPAGITANVVSDYAQGSSANAVSSEKELIDTDFAHGSTTDTTKNPGGVVKRLTVGVIVDLPEADPNATPPVVAKDPQEIEALVKQLVGIDEERGDEITVVVSKLTDPLATMTPFVDTVNQWEFYRDMVKNASLGMAAIVSLILGMMLIRRIRPITLTTVREPIGSERSSLLNELSTQAQQNPELVSRIMSAWLNSGRSATESEDESRRAAA